jgi:ribosomal protein L19E
MRTSWDTRNVTNNGLSMVSEKNAHTRKAVRRVVTNKGIWLSATRSVSRYSWKGRLKNRRRPEDQAVGLLMGCRTRTSGCAGPYQQDIRSQLYF